MTLATQRVLQVLLDRPADEKYGLEICAEAGLASGTIHPILARLEKVGWLESHWENIDPRSAGRPRRRYYRLSRDGAQQARSALAAVEARRFRGRDLAFPGGVG
ncbi:helix-turn-helix transcriptional regulator [Micromonospora sp. NPDC051196]|uniref:PadR family transcriptional regulator n=1 Tax=Micromonospora sp. NPDC051196 TaxID=3155281 RepID=UPI00344653E4